MALTKVNLLYPEKLSSTIKKKVTFDVRNSTTRTGYSQNQGSSLSNTLITIELQYLNLTSAERVLVETLFMQKSTETVVRFSDKVFPVKLFRLPNKWNVNRKISIIGNLTTYNYDLTFTLISL